MDLWEPVSYIKSTWQIKYLFIVLHLDVKIINRFLTKSIYFFKQVIFSQHCKWALLKTIEILAKHCSRSSNVNTHDTFELLDIECEKKIVYHTI